MGGFVFCLWCTRRDSSAWKGPGEDAAHWTAYRSALLLIKKQVTVIGVSEIKLQCKHHVCDYVAALLS